jgi:hypothetical protein
MKRCEEAGHRFGGFVRSGTGWARRCRRRSCPVVAVVTWEMATKAAQAGQIGIRLTKRTKRPILVPSPRR